MAERLTYRDKNGKAWAKLKTSASSEETMDFGRISLERLAAYEDTRLEPDEILTGLELAKIAMMQIEFDRYCALGTVEELTELVKVHKDGRAPILPCKVGEYWARDGKQYIVAEISVTSAWGIMVRHYEEGNGEMLSCNPQYFAKHYTHEEAEAALKEDNDERD